MPRRRYLFAGRGTFRDLGLVEHSLDRLPQPERSAMIWVTEGRMLCFEFDDSSTGGGGYTIDDAWVPPRGIQNDEATAGVPMQVIGASWPSPSPSSSCRCWHSEGRSRRAGFRTSLVGRAGMSAPDIATRGQRRQSSSCSHGACGDRPDYLNGNGHADPSGEGECHTVETESPSHLAEKTRQGTARGSCGSGSGWPPMSKNRPMDERGGRVEVIAGPMFAGKTEELLRRVGAPRSPASGSSSSAMPSTRGRGGDRIASHAGLDAPSRSAGSAEEIGAVVDGPARHRGRRRGAVLRPDPG